VLDVYELEFSVNRNNYLKKNLRSACFPLGEEIFLPPRPFILFMRGITSIFSWALVISKDKKTGEIVNN